MSTPLVGATAADSETGEYFKPNLKQKRSVLYRRILLHVNVINLGE